MIKKRGALLLRSANFHNAPPCESPVQATGTAPHTQIPLRFVEISNCGLAALLAQYKPPERCATAAIIR